MNDKQIFRTIGMIDDDLIAEAAETSNRMHRIPASKIAVIAAAVMILFGLTVFAASRLVVSTSSSGSNVPDYYSVPSEKTLKKDIGISFKLIERFTNGYKFYNGGISDNKDYDEDGNVVENYKSFHCYYKLGDDTVILHADKSQAGIQMYDCETIKVYKNSDIKYSAYTNKTFPGNYKLTEQDKQDQKEGKYVFSYGTEDIEIHEVQVMGWEYKGINYSFCTIDSNISKDDLCDMAAEIIDYQD